MAQIREIHPESPPPGEKPGGSRMSGMDVPRSAPRGKRRLPWILLGIAGLVGIGALLASLPAASPSVDGDLLVYGTVRQGPMIRQAHGWGSFVPDRRQLVQAEQPGVVEAVYAIEGQAVRSGDRLVELTNPEIELAVEKAEQKFAAARAGMIALSREQSARRLSLEAAIADTRIEFLRAEDDFEELSSQPAGKVREIDLKRARERVDALAKRLSADEERLALITSTTEQQLAARRDELRWVESILDSERERLQALTLRAAGDGYVERVSVQPGTRVAGGDVMAEVTLSDRLKAVVEVYAGEGADVAVGQPVTLEGTVGQLTGEVSEVTREPGAKVLSVTVALDENPPIPPDGDRDVDARIQLGTLDDVLSVERPVYASADGWSTVFKVSGDSASATRVKVRLGRGSVDRIEVLSGLVPGDRIVVSDISQFDDVDCFDID
jgi:multidrug efflux pump subunit AcrA (membrane-fusion protein)